MITSNGLEIEVQTDNCVDILTTAGGSAAYLSISMTWAEAHNLAYLLLAAVQENVTRWHHEEFCRAANAMSAKEREIIWKMEQGQITPPRPPVLEVKNENE